MQKQITENSFLTEFTNEIIRNYYKLYLERFEIGKIEREKEEGLRGITREKILPQRIMLQEKPQTYAISVRAAQIMPSQIQYQKQNAQPMPILFNIPSGKTGFDKLLPLLNDRSIVKIEYRAENQPLLVTKLGQTFATRITLTGQEAMEILQEFSRQSRIPLIKGIFRVHTKDFMVFAIISDFIKPRFMIQKTLFY